MCNWLTSGFHYREMIYIMCATRAVEWGKLDRFIPTTKKTISLEIWLKERNGLDNVMFIANYILSSLSYDLFFSRFTLISFIYKMTFIISTCQRLLLCYKGLIKDTKIVLNTTVLCKCLNYGGCEGTGLRSFRRLIALTSYGFPIHVHLSHNILTCSKKEILVAF